MIRADLLITNIREALKLPRDTHSDPTRALGICQDIAIAIEGAKISWIGPMSQVFSHVSSSRREIDASGKLVCPAFIDPHTHLTGYPYGRADDFAVRVYGESDYAGIARKGGGILTTVERTSETSEEQLRNHSLHILDEFLRQGVATIEGKSGYGLQLDEEIRQLRLLHQLDREHPVEVIPTYLAHIVDPQYRNNREHYVSYVIDEIVPKASKLARGIDVFCDDIAFDKQESQEILRAGQQHGLIATAHVDQTSPFAATEVLAPIGPKSLSHLEHVSSAGISAMVEHNVVAIVFPSCSLHLDTPFAPVDKLIASGIPVALSTDWNPGSSPCSSLLFVAYLAARKMRMPFVEVIRAMTINAAKALHIEKYKGSLESGKDADLCIFALDDWRDLVTQCCNPPEVTVIKGGKIVWDKGQRKV